MGKYAFCTIFHELCERLQHSGPEEVLNEFMQLPFESKVPYTYKLLLSKGLIPAKFDEISRKCREKYIEFKRTGNIAFLHKNDKDALKDYTKAVCFAPNDSEEIAIAYANRSAVLHSLEQYESCIIDIDRALTGLYPDGLRHKLLERKGKCLMQLQKKDLAKECFHAALRIVKRSSLLESQQKRIEENIKEELKDCDSSDTGSKSPKTNELKTLVLPQLRLVNKDIPNAFEHLRVEYSDSMGRCVIASRDIAPGEVLVVEKPYSSVLLPEFSITHCYYCFKRCLAMIPCPYCTLVMFCNEKCKNKSWETYHRVECQILAYILNFGFNGTHVLAIRTLLKATNQGDSIYSLYNHIAEYSYTNENIRGFNLEEKYLSQDYITIHHLEDNIGKQTTTDFLYRASAVSILLHIIKEKSTFFDQLYITDNAYKIESNRNNSLIKNENMDDGNKRTRFEAFIGGLLLQYLCIISCNANNVLEVAKKQQVDIMRPEKTHHIGAGLYPVISLLNHSCNPNVVMCSYEDTSILFAIQPIKMNQQVFYHYGCHYIGYPRNFRQDYLSQRYFFNCKCDACVFNWPLYEKVTQHVVYISSDASLLKQLKSFAEKFPDVFIKTMISDTDEHLPFFYQYLSLLHQTVRKPCKVYVDCQEIIRRCLTIGSNYYCKKSDIII